MKKQEINEKSIDAIPKVHRKRIGIHTPSDPMPTMRI